MSTISTSLEGRAVCLGVSPAARLVSRLDLALALLWSCLQPQCSSVQGCAGAYWDHTLSPAAAGRGGLELCLTCPCSAPAIAPTGLTRIPHAPSATVISLCLHRVLQKSGLPLIPAMYKLVHPPHPIQSKPVNGRKKASAETNLLKSLYSGVDMASHYPTDCCMGRPLKH